MRWYAVSEVFRCAGMQSLRYLDALVCTLSEVYRCAGMQSLWYLDAQVCNLQKDYGDEVFSLKNILLRCVLKFTKHHQYCKLVSKVFQLVCVPENIITLERLARSRN